MSDEDQISHIIERLGPMVETSVDHALGRREAETERWSMRLKIIGSALAIAVFLGSAVIAWADLRNDIDAAEGLLSERTERFNRLEEAAHRRDLAIITISKDLEAIRATASRNEQTGAEILRELKELQTRGNP